MAGTAGLQGSGGRAEEGEEEEGYWFSPRSRRQFGVFAFGAASVYLSTRLTFRVLARKRRQMVPPFYRPSNAPPANAVNGPAEAVQALAIASVNVFSAGFMLAGGALWAADVSSLAEMRVLVRRGLGVDGSGRSEQDVEEEFEEWLAKTLDRSSGRKKKNKNKKRKRREEEEDEEEDEENDEEEVEDRGRSASRAKRIADDDEVRKAWLEERARSRR